MAGSAHHPSVPAANRSLPSYILLSQGVPQPRYMPMNLGPSTASVMQSHGNQTRFPPTLCESGSGEFVSCPMGSATNSSGVSSSHSASGASSGGVAAVTVNHSSSTGSVFRCPLCEKVFTNSSAVAKHKLTHSDERKYVCNVCNKAFKRQDHLSGHKLTHESRKPHACRLCDKSFTDSRSLRRHYENQHLDSGRLQTRWFPGADGPEGSGMDTCEGGPGFTLEALLDPLNEPKCFRCAVCGKGFRNQAALNGHMRLHGGYGTTSGQGTVEPGQKEHSLQDSPGQQPHRSYHVSVSHSDGDRPDDDGQYSVEPSPLSSNVSYQQMNHPESQSPYRRVVDLEAAPSFMPPQQMHSRYPTELVPSSNAPELPYYHVLSTGFHPTTTHPLQPMGPNAASFSIASVTQGQQHYSPITPVDTTPGYQRGAVRNGLSSSHFSFDPAHVHHLAQPPAPLVTVLPPSVGPLNSAEVGQPPSPPQLKIVTTTGSTLLQEEASKASFTSPPQPVRPSESIPSEEKHAEAISSFMQTSMSPCVFRNPRGPPPSKKVKHKPAPLHIPPQVNAFVSRLRSPRLFGVPSLVEAGDSGANVSVAYPFGGLASPKYTPPPMLSPRRKGPGLFVSLTRSQVSASSTPKHPLSLANIPNWNGSTSTESYTNLQHVCLKSPETVAAASTTTPQTSVTNCVFGYDQQSVEKCVAGETECHPAEEAVSSEDELEEEELLPDGVLSSAVPAINIGPAFQAVLPSYCPDPGEALKDPHEYEVLLWDPNLVLNDPEREKSLELLMKIACSPAISECGLNLEYAFHLVHKCNADLDLALKGLLHQSFAVFDYIYAETTQWTTEEIQCFQQNIRAHDRDFNKVSQALCAKGMSKSVKACVEFYYMWKRMNTSAEVQFYTKHQPSRSAPAHRKRATPDTAMSEDDVLHHQTLKNFFHEDGAEPQDGYFLRKKPVAEVPPENGVEGPHGATVFPCDVCGKVFRKVKSRNAHMKYHKEKS